MYGIMFLVLGNISGNAVAFGVYVAIAAGKKPLTSSEDDYSKGLVNGLAILCLSLCAAIHIFSRRGGVLLNNLFAIIKVSMVVALSVLGFVHAGGRYLQASGINEPAVPNFDHPNNFVVNNTRINNAMDDNFHSAFATGRSDVASYVYAFHFVLFSYTGFEQPFYVLSEVSYGFFSAQEHTS
jgi:amino acid transporter